MSISIAYIPKGYTSEQKAIMIRKTKEACMKGLGLKIDHSFVFVQEIEPDCMDEQTKNMKCLVFSDSHGYADNMIEAVRREQPTLCFFLGVTA